MWSLLEQKTLQKNSYWSEHTEMKMTWYTNGIFVISYPDLKRLFKTKLKNLMCENSW